MSKSRLTKRKSIVTEIGEGRGKGAPRTRKKPYVSRTFKIDEDLYRALKAAAAKGDTTMTDILHKALWKYVNTEMKKDKES